MPFEAGFATPPSGGMIVTSPANTLRIADAGSPPKAWSETAMLQVHTIMGASVLHDK
jgi:hypothetical protein